MSADSATPTPTPTPTPTDTPTDGDTSTPPTAIEALQQTLTAEHAAVYCFGVMGARTSRSADPDLFARLTDSFGTHRGRRDQLIAIISRMDQTPVAASPAYDLPGSAGSAREATATALRLEQGCTAWYAALVASTRGANREWAALALTASAVAQLGYGGRPQDYPGLDQQ